MRNQRSLGQRQQDGALPTTEPRWLGKLRTEVTMATVSHQPPPLSATTASVTACAENDPSAEWGSKHAFVHCPSAAASN